MTVSPRFEKEQRIVLFTGRRPVAVPFFGRNDTFDTRLEFSLAFNRCLDRVRLSCDIPLQVTIAFKNKALRDERISKRSTVDPPSIGAPPTCLHFTVRTQMCENRLVGDASKVRECSFVNQLPLCLSTYLRSIRISVYLEARFQDSRFQI